MHKGSCHCGEIAFEVEGEFDKVIECNCSHCSRKGLLLWFVPRGNFTLRSSADRLASYKFNKHVIDHRFCSNCGAAPFAFGTDPKGKEIAAINVRCLEDVDLATLPRVPHDGRSA